MKFCCTWYPMDITLCLRSGFIYPRWMGSLLLVSQKNCTACSLDSSLSHHCQFRIDAHRRKACRRGRPCSLFWSAYTHRSRRPTLVASERFVSIWATGRYSRFFVLREYPVVSAKRMRHALPAWPPWVSPCTTRSMVRRHPRIYSDGHQCQYWCSWFFFSFPVSW